MAKSKEERLPSSAVEEVDFLDFSNREVPLCPCYSVRLLVDSRKLPRKLLWMAGCRIQVPSPFVEPCAAIVVNDYQATKDDAISWAIEHCRKAGIPTLREGAEVTVKFLSDFRTERP